MARKNYSGLCQQILENVGGKENVVSVMHCETRLRFTLKDRSLADKEAVTALKDVMGCQFVGEQFQVIIGQFVHDVYADFCELLGIEQEEQINENPDPVLVNKKSPKYWGKAFLDAINGCIMPLIPIIVGAGIIKLIVVLLGPNIAGLFAEDSDIITVLTFVGDAGFYFLPIFTAWSAAGYFKTNIPLALFIGAVFLHPTLTALISEGGALTVYGIPATLPSFGYSSNFLPTILSVWIMSYVYRFLNEHVPNMIKMAVVPAGTVLVMLPISLCITGPLGTYCGQLISNVAVWISEGFGPLAMGLIAGGWYILVGLGMDKALGPVFIQNFATLGYDNLFWLSAIFGTYALIGIAAAYILRCKKEEKTAAATNALTLVLGGISEPVIFGVLWRFRRALAYLFIGGFVGGFIGGIFQVKAYAMGTGNILFAAVCAGGDGSGLLPAIIASVISFGISFALAMIFGFEGKKQTA